MDFKNGRYLLLGLLCITTGVYSITLKERLAGWIDSSKLALSRVYDRIMYPTLEERGINTEFDQLRQDKIDLDVYLKPNIRLENIANKQPTILRTLNNYAQRIHMISSRINNIPSLSSNKTLANRLAAAKEDLKRYQKEFREQEQFASLKFKRLKQQ
jgi:hypothetical protein